MRWITSWFLMATGEQFFDYMINDNKVPAPVHVSRSYTLSHVCTSMDAHQLAQHPT